MFTLLEFTIVFTVLFKEVYLDFDSISYNFKETDFLIKGTCLTLFNFLVLIQLVFLNLLSCLKYDVTLFELVCTLQVCLSTISTIVLYFVKKDLK